MFRGISVVLTSLLAGICVAASQPVTKTESGGSTSGTNPVLVADNKTSKPTGACYITAGSVSNCTSGMTQQACYNVAAKVGGVADWQEGQNCK